MTVTSLWTVLDEAGCGTCVGVDDFELRGRGDKPEQQTTLAVDLSIWVCEGIASSALSSFHCDPALHLVYQRTVKLLRLGLGLVFVVEGKRRVRSQATTTTTTSTSSSTHELKQRRSGSRFWTASKRCERLLQLLNVPVVRAKAEGEALCALLNLQNVVQGVITNDGDSLLFGAKTVYKGFTAENLEARKVVRYDSDNLVANLDGNNRRTIKLSREDLIAFAMLAGSDLVGDAIPHIGGKKAIQFLHACRSLKDSCNDRTCLDELLSWADVAVEATKSKDDSWLSDCDDDGSSRRCCSLCLHPGDKVQHEKHGCAECNTGPGEGCYVVTSSEKFLRSLKEKAIGQLLAPRHVVNEYFTPNSNVVPSELTSLKSKSYDISPDSAKLFAMELIIKGRTSETSRECLRQTLPKLLARLDLFSGPRTQKELFKPTPLRINKTLVKQSWPCFEVTWTINTHPLNDEQFQFCTLECQTLLTRSYPQLVKEYHRNQRHQQQGRAEDERRKRLQQPGRQRKRDRNFVAKVRKVQKTSTRQARSSDVSLLMGNVGIGESEQFEPLHERAQTSVEQAASNSASTTMDNFQLFNNLLVGDRFDLEHEPFDESGGNDNQRDNCDCVYNYKEPPERTWGSREKSSVVDEFVNTTDGNYSLHPSNDRHCGATSHCEANGTWDWDSHLLYNADAYCGDDTVVVNNEAPLCPLSPTNPIFCDLGGIQIEVTPLVSRR